MATTPVTPAAASASAAAPAAAATASTSSAAPASTSTPVTTHQSDGQSGSGALNHDQQIDAMMTAWDAKKPQAVDPAAAATVTDPAAAAADPAAAATTDADPAAAAATTEGEGDSEYSFDEDGFTGAVDLAKKLDTIQGLDPAVRNEILANARIAEQLAPYREIFGSPEEAKVVAQAAQDWTGVQTVFQSIAGDNVKEGTSSLINEMLKLSALRDDSGAPRRREDGTYITDGTTTRFFNEVVDRKLGHLASKYKDDAALQAAVDLVMERAGMRPSTADNTTGQDPAIAQERARLADERKQFETQKENERKTSVKNYTEALGSDLKTTSETAFTTLLGKATGVRDDRHKASVIRDLSKAVKAAVEANPGYMLEKRGLEGRPMTAERRQQEVALAKRFLAAHLVRIATPILAAEGISLSKKAANQAATQTAREQASRGEVTGGAPGQQKPATAQDPAAQRAQVIEAFKQKNGRAPSDTEVLTEMMMNLPGIKNRAA